MNTGKVVCKIDAQALTPHVNINPHSYTYAFRQPVTNVTRVSLLRSSIPRSQVFTLIRVSNWEASGTLLVNTDTFHQMAVRMATAIGSHPFQSSYVATITNPAGTVNLQVHDVYTRTASRTGGDFKTYDVLVCTGTVLSATFADWLISAEGETANTQITPTGDAALLTVDVSDQPAVLHLRLNGSRGAGRIQEVATRDGTWMSYIMYNPGDIVHYNLAKYVCTTKHLSIMFNTELSAGWWSVYQSQQSSASASDNAFEVFHFADASQSLDINVFNHGDVVHDTFVPNVQSISVEWMQRNGQPFIFPHKPRIRVTDLDSTANYTYERDYTTPCLHIELAYQR